MMTVCDFLDFCTSDFEEIVIFDFNSGEEVFTGTIMDAMYSDYADCEVESYDLNYGKYAMCLNIAVDED